MSNNNWDKFYKETPLEEISWQKTQADYLSEVVDTHKVDPGLALDLGCGTGMKSIFLAQNGFTVTGVDISETAINYARDNAKKENVEIELVAHDATDLSFLGDKQFDLVLDWANLHGIEEKKVDQYVRGIMDHLKVGGKMILRCFGREEGEEKKVIRPDFTITLYTEKELEGLFIQTFKILERNISKPGGPNPPGKFFYEFLMERAK